MPTEQEWKQINEKKEKSISRAIDRKEVSIDSWAGMNNAVAIAVPKLLKERASLVTREDYVEEIKYFYEEILKIVQEKKDYLSIPVVEDIEIIPIKEGDQLTPKEYVKRSRLEDLEAEEKQGKDLPF